MRKYFVRIIVALGAVITALLCFLGFRSRSGDPHVDPGIKARAKKRLGEQEALTKDEEAFIGVIKDELAMKRAKLAERAEEIDGMSLEELSAEWNEAMRLEAGAQLDAEQAKDSISDPVVWDGEDV